MAVLVTGGAGYIGSFVVRELMRRGRVPVVLDDLSTGHARSVAGVPLVEMRCGDLPRVARALARLGVEAVVHMAGKSLVGESVREPALYWDANVGQTAGLLRACREAGIERFVFSSSAAVYGEPLEVPIDEEHPLAPTNPYGATKAAIEQMLAACRDAGELGYVALRYFNAAGAAEDGSLGEDHDPETHLVPNVLRAITGETGPLTIFGDDYPTRDGTCVRDYVHVLDLARAHVLALDWLEAHPGEALACNLGTGEGASVAELIGCAETVTGNRVPHAYGPRREGDPAVLVASNARARSELGWRPERSDLESILADAWRWHSSRRGATPRPDVVAFRRRAAAE